MVNFWVGEVGSGSGARLDWRHSWCDQEEALILGLVGVAEQIEKCMLPGKESRTMGKERVKNNLKDRKRKVGEFS